MTLISMYEFSKFHTFSHIKFTDFFYNIYYIYTMFGVFCINLRSEGWNSHGWSHSRSPWRALKNRSRSQGTASHVRMSSNEHYGFPGTRCKSIFISMYHRVQFNLRRHFVRNVEKHIESCSGTSSNATRNTDSHSCLQVHKIFILFPFPCGKKLFETIRRITI